MTKLNPDAGVSTDPDGLPQLTVTPGPDGPDLELFQAPDHEGFVAYWIFGLPETNQMQMVDLLHLPDGMDIIMHVSRHGWSAPSITRYTSEQAVVHQEASELAYAGAVEPVPVNDGTHMAVEDVLRLMELLVGDETSLHGLALPAAVAGRLDKAVSDGVIEVTQDEQAVESATPVTDATVGEA